MQAELGQIIVLLVGIFTIGASLWRVGTAIYRILNRWDRMTDEHDNLLKATAANTEAIIRLNRRLDRMDRRRG